MVKETTLALLQLVALALPAVVIFMQVLTEIHMDAAGPRGTATTEAHHKLDFSTSRWTLLFFVLAGLVLVAKIILASLLPSAALEVLLAVAGVLIGLAFLSFLGSVWIMRDLKLWNHTRQKVKNTRLWARMKSLLSDE